MKRPQSSVLKCVANYNLMSDSMKTKRDIFACKYLLCIAAYILLSDLNQAAGTLLSEGVVSNDFFRTLLMVAPAYALMLLCGLMVGLQSERNSVLHASIATMIGVSIHINFITSLAVGDYTKVFLMLAFGVVLGGVGGLVSVAIKRMRSRHAKTECNTDHSGI